MRKPKRRHLCTKRTLSDQNAKISRVAEGTAITGIITTADPLPLEALLRFRRALRQQMTPTNPMPPKCDIRSDPLSHSVTKWHPMAPAGVFAKAKASEKCPLACDFVVPPARFERAAPALGERCSVP